VNPGDVTFLAARVATFPWLTEAQCSSILAAADDGSWEPARFGQVPVRDQTVQPERRRQSVIGRSAMPARLRSLTDFLVTDLSPVAGRLLGLAPPLDVQVLEIQRTGPGEYIDWHADSSESRPRRLVCMVYLSDRTSGLLAGGETEIRAGSETVVVTPERGRAVVFDAGLRHRGRPVEQGVKFCLTANFL
jgi:hypothetical protein